MEHNKNSITITLLEIKPSLKELEKNNKEISIIFQGINVFYSLRKLISNNTEIFVNNCKNSLIMSLVRSDNIFASALFNLKHGENWVAFNYETKTKVNIKNNFNNINCIKIKIFCNTNASEKNNKSQLNNKSINHNNSKTKRYHTNKNILNIKKSNNNDNNNNYFKYNSLLTECNNNLYQVPIKKTLNKKASGKIKSSELIKKTRNHNNINQLPSVNNNNRLSLATVSFRRLNTSCNNINVNNKKILMNSHSFRSSNNNIQKLKTQKSIQNFDYLTKTKYIEVKPFMNRNYMAEYNKSLKSSNSINNTKKYLYLENNSPPKVYCNKAKQKLINKVDIENNLYFGYNKNSNNNNLNDNKAKLIIKNRLCKSKIQGNITNSYSTTTTKKNEFEGSLNSFQDDFDKKNNKKKNFLTSNRQKIQKDSFNNKDKSQNRLTSDNNNQLNAYKIKENEGISNSKEKENKEDYFSKYLEEEGDQDFGFDEFTRLKNDLNLLYNKEYIYNIKNELLKLEIELFVEKMIELISVYHRIIEERINENKIAKNNYKRITKRYMILYKLYKKLQLINDKYKTKKYNLDDNKRNIKQQTNNNLLLNKEEFNIFDKLINNNINCNKRLKEILNVILKNTKIKNLIKGEKFQMWLLEKQIKNKNIPKNINIRTKAIPKKQHTKILSNISEIEINNDNSILINKIKTGGIYIKKTPKSPLGSKNKNSQININNNQFI